MHTHKNRNNNNTHILRAYNDALKPLAIGRLVFEFNYFDFRLLILATIQCKRLLHNNYILHLYCVCFSHWMYRRRGCSSLYNPRCTVSYPPTSDWNIRPDAHQPCLPTPLLCRHDCWPNCPSAIRPHPERLGCIPKWWFPAGEGPGHEGVSSSSWPSWFGNYSLFITVNKDLGVHGMWTESKVSSVGDRMTVKMITWLLNDSGVF